MLPCRVVLLEDRDPHHQPEMDALTKIGVEVLEAGDAVSEADILGVCAVANGLVLPQVIARYGIGYGNVDVEATTEKGITAVPWLSLALPAVLHLSIK